MIKSLFKDSRTQKSSKKLSLLPRALLVFVFVLPLSQYLSARIMVVLCVLALFESTSNDSISRFFRNSWDIMLYLLVLIVGLSYSDNLTLGLRVLETNLSLLGIPFIFSRVVNLDEKRINQTYYAFASGLCLACGICLINAALIYDRTGNVDSFFFYSLTDILNFQPTYFAYYLIFSITFGLYLLYYQKNEEYLVIKSACILFLFLVLMLTGGQTAFVSMLLIFAFFILKFLIEEKSRIKNLTICLIIFMLLDMFLTTIISKGDRALQLSDAWDRLIVWESAINAIPNPLFGVGTGDYKTVLNQYFVAHGLQTLAEESYNSHNQLIQLLFSNGLLGVVAFIFMIARPLYISFKNDHILATLSLFPFLIYGITEVFLGRYQGVVFFAFLHQFFIAQLNSKSPSLLIKPS